MDDLSSHKVMGSNVNNPMYTIFTTRRHLGIYHIIASVHSVSVVYGKSRDNPTGWILT